MAPPPPPTHPPQLTNDQPLDTLLAKKFRTSLILDKKVSENKTVQNFYAAKIFTVQYKTFKYFLGQRHHMYSRPTYMIYKARTRIIGFSVVLYITGKPKFLLRLQKTLRVR